jgi:mono/diheme cytochrome c family protein
MYSSGFRADQVDDLRELGVVGSSDWINPAKMNDRVALGEEIFRIACANCHARDGYNGMRMRVQHWNEELTAAMVQRIEYMRRKMPPWVGTQPEAEALAAYLMTLKDPTIAIAAARATEPLDGEAVFGYSCASCHSVDGFRAIREMVEGLTAEDLEEYLLDMESDEMPPFTGSNAERRALAEWLENVGAGTEDEIAVLGGAAAEGGAR